MSQICIRVLLGPSLTRQKQSGCSVFFAQLLHRLKLLSSGLSMRHYQGQSVTVNYTSLPPNQSLVPQGQLHCCKFLIHNLIFYSQPVEAPQPKPTGEHTAFHSWLTQRPKQNGAHWHFTCRGGILNLQHCIFFFPTDRDKFSKAFVFCCLFVPGVEPDAGGQVCGVGKEIQGVCKRLDKGWLQRRMSCTGGLE